MIGRLTGILLDKSPPQITLDVHGVGYELEVPMSTFYNLPDIGGKLALFTHLLVREDGHLLYGFASQAERAAFRQLIRITGVGPRIALALLSGLSVGELAQAVAMQESARLTRVPGIGKKTAERLLLELRDKLPASGAIASAAAAPSEGADVLNALLALGYSEKEALAAIRQLAPELGVSEGIRAALKLLSKL